MCQVRSVPVSEDGPRSCPSPMGQRSLTKCEGDKRASARPEIPKNTGFTSKSLFLNTLELYPLF